MDVGSGDATRGFVCREEMDHQLDRLAVTEMVPVKRCFVVCVELFIHSFRKVGVDTQAQQILTVLFRAVEFRNDGIYKWFKCYQEIWISLLMFLRNLRCCQYNLPIATSEPYYPYLFSFLYIKQESYRDNKNPFLKSGLFDESKFVTTNKNLVTKT